MNVPEPPLLLAVMGTTASGKTDLAEALAEVFDAQLINGDSFQVYRGLDIGTAKSANRERYRLLDIKDPDEPFGVGEWRERAQEVLADLWTEQRHAVVVGGSGLYIRALFEQYSEMRDAPDPELRDRLNHISLPDLQSELARVDPAAMQNLDLLNPMRVKRAIERALMPPKKLESRVPPFRRVKFCVERDPAEVLARIESRAEQMVRDGWLEEVRSLRDQGYSPDDPGMRAHGYRHIWQVLEGTMEMSQALLLTTGEVRRYAKRQRTWLRKEPGLIPLERDDPLSDALRRVEVFFGGE